MSIFRKSRERQEEDYEYEEEEREIEKHKPSTKKFKDLKPQNKKKRKEPPKPWGKKERILVLSVFVISIALAGGLGGSARNWKLPGLPKLVLPRLNLFEEEVVVISRKPVTDNDEQKAKDAIKTFQDLTGDLSGIYSFLIIDLDKEISYGENDSDLMQAASLIKLPVIATVYIEAEKGELDLDSNPSGSSQTYRELVEAMGQRSDNNAQKIVVASLGKEKINQTIETLGMKDTSLEENETSPRDVGLFFEKLWKGEIVSEKHKKEILEYLTDTIYEDWIASGVPDGVRVAHKYGREVHVVNDAGIVYSKNPFVMVLMTDGVVEKEADAIIPQIAEELYNIQTRQ